MPNYLNGKVYKIVDNTNGNVYIGSTAEPTLARRLAGHVRTYKHWVRTGKGNTKSFDIIKNGDYRIVLLETCPCSNKDELTQREQHHMDHNECINQKRAYLTAEQREEYFKQYGIDNKDKRKEYNAQYHIDNQEKRKQCSAQWHFDNKEQSNIGRKARHDYQNTWGGNPQSNNNLLKIDPKLFQ